MNRLWTHKNRMRRWILALILSSTGLLRAQDSLSIQAKGIWIWELWTANGGNLSAVIDQLKSVGVGWVIIKMADSDSYYNSSGHSLYNWAVGYGGMDSVISTFHQNGIKVIGYQYIYGIPHWGDGFSESQVANMMLSVKGLDGLAIDAEIEFDTLATRVATARAYVDSIRAHYPATIVALASWARVASHSTFPWVQFLDGSTVNMPQTYWAARPTTPSTELTRMSSDFATYTPMWVSGGDSAAAKPIMPIGQAEYFGYSNDVAQGDIASFCSLSQSTYKYPGVSLWEYTEITHSYVWDEYTAAWTAAASVLVQSGLPETFDLRQNYPNPFNPSTVISYELPVSSEVTLRVYDLLGREVATLVTGKVDAGIHAVTFDATRFGSGIYFYRITAGPFVDSRKMVLLR